MNARLLPAFLAALTLGSGCIVYDTDPYDDCYECGDNVVPAQPGDVTIAWTFMGAYCSEAPEVKSVRVSIPGEALANDGVYPCSANGFSGIELHDFYPGRYGFTVTAFGYSGERLYEGGGSFVIDGDVRVNVDLTPLGGPTSYAHLYWSFPRTDGIDNPTCAQAGIRYVDAKLDDADWVRLDCAAGQGASGVKTPLVAPGTHSLKLVAVDVDGYAYYSLATTLVTEASRPVAAQYQLKWAVGGAAVRWDLKDGSLAKTCATAGVQSVTINFQDAQGNLVYGATGDTHACDAAPILYNFLQPGTYKVFLKGTGSGGVVYLSDAASPPLVTIVAGQFAGPADAGTVTLLRAN